MPFKIRVAYDETAPSGRTRRFALRVAGFFGWPAVLSALLKIWLKQ